MIYSPAKPILVKKLLITSLQFLSNLVTLNERLKLMLWVELFDTSPESLHANPPMEPVIPSQDMNVDKWVRNAIEDFKQQQTQQHIQQAVQASSDAITLTPRDLYEWDQEEEIMNDLLKQDPNYRPQQISVETDRRWQHMTEKEKEPWTSMPEDMVAQMKDSIFKVPAFEPGRLLSSDSEADLISADVAELELNHPPDQTTMNTYDAKAIEAKISEAQPTLEPFWRAGMMESAADGARKLREGKVQLLKRLEHVPQDNNIAGNIVSPASPADPPIIPEHEQLDVEAEENINEDEDDGLEDELEEDEEEEEEDMEEDEESDEDDYAIPGEDGRGLLTDVPLILGPNEIEVLPMIIMSGIVAPGESVHPQPKPAQEEDNAINMYTIRCHLLLAQENGRNLLRELLIFVAAWDLREEELYFKFMVKIMEAILMNGLMPFAYGAFKESKDIISPAQAVIMKLLTKIFHSRQNFISGSPHFTTPSSIISPDSRYPQPSKNAQHRYDVQIVHCLFSEFRQNIIPQICALIFLQGQIRVGHAAIEDFPLNLWDMERMYEGVYQYLEFFAILTDHDHWKQLMAEWEVTSELLTLLNELEKAIPKGRLVAPHPTLPPPPPPPPPAATAAAAATPTQTQSTKAANGKAPLPTAPTAPVPVAVERPYDVNAPSNGLGGAPADEWQQPTQEEYAEAERVRAEFAAAGGYEKTTPASSPFAVPPAPHQQQQQTQPAQVQPSQPQPQSQPQQTTQSQPHQPQLPTLHHDDPATFEWRNLKKLCILVLSSLVWKYPRLQNQVRVNGGILSILACCSHDDHNPYIREHAIMCLRFLLEGNAENRGVVVGLAGGGVGEENGAGGASGGGEEVKLVDGGKEGERRSMGAPPLVVPVEVLDQHAYETFVDGKGQVGLRRKPSILSSDREGAAASALEGNGNGQNYGRRGR